MIRLMKGDTSSLDHSSNASNRMLEFRIRVQDSGFGVQQDFGLRSV